MNKLYSLLLIVSLTGAFTSCEVHYDFPLNRAGDWYWQHFTWHYQDHEFNLTLRLPVATYDHYRKYGKNMPYARYAFEDSAYPYLREVARELYVLAAPYHFTRTELAEFILAFVQEGFPYESDPVGFTDYPRFAIESLLERQGDCEDKAICWVSILSALGYYSCLIELPQEAHMAAGAAVDGTALYQGESGRMYCFGECTNPGWELGVSSYPGESVLIFEIPPMKPQRVSRHNRGTRTVESLHENKGSSWLSIGSSNSYFLTTRTK